MPDSPGCEARRAVREGLRHRAEPGQRPASLRRHRT
jgi:hypothetical protein